jgi:patatin-like phospholipase/acyl hydrolase
MLRDVIGEDTTLGSDKLHTLLMMVLRNATTDSPWPLTNNPAAKYNDLIRPGCNLKLPVWQLVRASTAAPTYFPPEVIHIDHEFIFVDGGVTMYNNPAFQLFLMATSEPYRLLWPTGQDKMLLISVGTGASANANSNLSPEEMNLIYNASTIPSALMAAAQHEQDFLCRIFGRCLAGDLLDREIGTVIGQGIPNVPKLFTYARYNAELSREGLDALGLEHINPVHVQQMDSVDHIDEMQEVGRAVAEQKVKAEHFVGFPMAN